MTPGRLRRFVLLTAFALLALCAAVVIVDQTGGAPTGDYATRKGDILLADREWEAALAWFDKALAVAPQHRGALMGRAIALMQGGRTEEAEAAFGRLIDRLAAPPDGDAASRGALAAAYANRGILYDRSGRPEQALDDYRAALAIDPAAVEGPGIGHRIVHANAMPSSVAKRARYLEQQLSLPPEQRRLHDAALDARERMHKP